MIQKVKPRSEIQSRAEDLWWRLCDAIKYNQRTGSAKKLTLIIKF